MSYGWVVLATGIGLGLGIIIWGVLCRHDRASALPFRQLFLIVIITGVICRIAIACFNPTFNAPDEQAHFKYVKYIYEERTFPVQTSKMDAFTNDWEYYQPPVYYILLAPVYGIATRFSGESHITIVVFRFGSIALWLINIFLALKILNHLGVQDLLLRIFTMGMVCLLPTYTFLSSSINNDNLLITLSGLIFLLTVRNQSFRNSLLIGVLCGVALLTKATALIVLLGVVAWLITRWIRGFQSLSATVFHLLLICIPALLIWAPWAFRNFNLYGDVIGHSAAGIPVKWPSVFHAFRYTLVDVKASFWSVSGIHNSVRFLPFIGIHITYFAILGFVRALIVRNIAFRDYVNNKGVDFMISMAVAIAFSIALVLQFGFEYGQGQGRFLFPLLIPISLLTAFGISFLGIRTLPRMHIHFTGLFIAYVLCFTVFSFAMFALKIHSPWYAV